MIGKFSERPKIKRKRIPPEQKTTLKTTLKCSLAEEVIAKSCLLMPINHRIEDTKCDRAYLKKKATNPARYHMGENILAFEIKTRTRAMPCAIMHIFNLKNNNTDFIYNYKPVAQRVLLWEYAYFQAST